jgi:hypothetical protein
MASRPVLPRVLLAFLILASGFLFAQTASKITPPEEALGFRIGDDYMVASYTQLEAYWKKLASESNRMKLVDIGPTAEGRRQYMAIVSAPENIRNLDHYREISRKLALAEGVTEAQAHALAREGKAVVWIDGGLHATETVGSQQLIEMVYQMASRTDPETMRFLQDVIQLYVPANPDGQELVANWYMRGSEDPKAPLLPKHERTMRTLPRLYAKYIGHDDNRDFYMSNMPETTNMNRVLFREWFPQILYNHHQTGPAGAVIFMPPFRDPFNYNFDPLVPVGIELVGAAMHSRLIAEGKGGSTMRSGANYSTWWNGGLRTICYFHNMIGILTEIIGDPAPMSIPLVAEKQLPQGDWPLPAAPQTWHYRQSIDYEITNNRAVLDIASRYRESWLFNIWRMGMNSIEKGSRDNWTITPKRIAAVERAAGMERTANGARILPTELYAKILHDPKLRDARGYIIPSDQPDFPTATEFVNALWKCGITVLRATAPFTVAGKTYPSGSYVVKTAQAFRPHIMDLFEPQDHPNDFRYPGGPPVPPYDITGWTLAMQMGVQYDRIFDGFDGPFTKVEGLMEPPPAAISGPPNPAGYLISHRINNSFKLLNRLLQANADVYWLKRDVEHLGAGAIWTPDGAVARSIVAAGARELGVPVTALAETPAGPALKLNRVRIGLYDQYGGSIPSGWIRWLFEQYEFPFERVFPAELDAGNLRSRFDVLVFPDGAIRRDAARGGGPDPERIPEKYRGWLGRITQEKTIPQLIQFLEAGGTIVTIGSSTAAAAAEFGVAVRNWLTETGADGREHPLPREKFFIPGALLRVNIDNTNPLAYGMPPQADVFFDNSPVLKLEASGARKNVSAVAWFQGPDVLESGWAWGQQYLDGGVAAAEAVVGEGRVILLGPEVAFRGQPHATFKLLFNGLYYGSAKEARLP